MPYKHHRNPSKPSPPPKMAPPDRLSLASEDLVSQEEGFKSSPGFDGTDALSRHKAVLSLEVLLLVA